MFRNFLHFIKYNNATVAIVLAFFVLGAGVFASEPGREALGQKTTRIEGVDNTLLLAADPAKLSPDFKISKIEQDERYYYVTYTYVELVLAKQVWQYQLTEKVKRVPLDLREDLGQYLAQEFKEEEAALAARVRQAQEKALAGGPAARQEVTEYSGLIGKVLDLGQAAFPGYEPVKRVKLPLPDFAAAALPPVPAAGSSDNLTDVYLDYINSHDLSDLGSAAQTTTSATSSPDGGVTATTSPAADPGEPAATEPSVSSVELAEPAATEPPAAEPAVTIITLPEPAAEPAKPAATEPPPAGQ